MLLKSSSATWLDLEGREDKLSIVALVLPNYVGKLLKEVLFYFK
jgi:hypothetical protein